MKVFIIHVGNELSLFNLKNPEFYLKRKSLIDGELKYFLKHDIINADLQMRSLINEGIEVDYGHFSNRKSILNLFKTGWKLRQITSNKDIDIVHVLWGSTTALMTVLFSKKPVVISFCGSDLFGAKNGAGQLTKGGKINRFLSKFASLLSAHNITKSNQMLQFLPEKSQSKTTVIPNGVDLKGFYPMNNADCKSKLKWDANKKHILFFYTEGQLVKNKPMALNVFNHIKKHIEQVEIKFITKIPHEELVYYYNAADVMILTSFHEGSNNSIKEANACNLPIVSVDVGDTRERLENVSNCYVLDSYDELLFANKVMEVLKSGKRSNGIKEAEKVSLEKVAHNVINVYKKVLNGSNNN